MSRKSYAKIMQIECKSYAKIRYFISVGKVFHILICSIRPFL